MAYIFNSKIENPERLERMLVARRPLVDLLEKRAKALINKGTLSQTLLIGPRGSGKTHMLKVFFNRVWNNPKRKEKIVVAYMVEDEYGIDTFLDLLIRIFNAFMRWYENDETKQLAEEIEKLKRTNPDQRESFAIDILNQYLNGRDLLIIIENLNDIFQGLGKEGQARLRDYIQQYNSTAIFASSQALFSDIQQEDKPFQNFFNITHLKKLSYEEAMLLVNALAEEEKLEDFKTFLDTPRGKANVHAVFDLTQGNHRLLVTFFDFLKAEYKSDLAEAFLHTIDKLKPYYESYFKLLSPQQQKIVQYLSSKRKPVTGKEISLNSFIPHTTVSKQMSELQKLGYVESTKVGKEAYYEIAEPMLRLAFEINENKKGIISIFIDFLTQLYEVEEITKRYLRFKFLSDFQSDNTKSLFQREATFYKEALSKVKALDLDGHEKVLQKITSLPERETYIKNIVFDQARSNLSEHEHELQSLIAQDKLNEALELLQRLESSSSQIPLYYFVKGFVLHRLFEFSSALKSYNIYIKQKPKDYRAWHNIGMIQFELNEFYEAITSFSRAISLNEKLYDTLVNIGVCYERIGNIELAEQNYRKAIDLGQNHSESTINLIKLYYYNNRTQESEKLASELVQNEPFHTEALYYYGLSLRANTKINEAKKVFEETLEIDPNQPESIFLLGIILFDEGKYPLALEKFQKAIQIEPDSAQYWYHLGITLYRLDSYQESLNALQKSNSLEPEHFYTLSMIANVHHQLNDDRNAILYLEQALKLDEESFHVLFNLAGYYKQSGEINKALEYYLQSIKIDPKNDLAWFQLARVYEEKKQLDNAKSAYEKAIELNPKEHQNWNGLILLHLSKQDLEQANLLIQEAFEKVENLESLHALNLFVELLYGNNIQKINFKFGTWLDYASVHKCQYLTNLDLILAETLYLVGKGFISISSIIEVFERYYRYQDLVNTIGRAVFHLFNEDSNLSAENLAVISDEIEKAKISENVKQKLLLYLSVGIELKDTGDRKVLLRLTKEERQVFLNFNYSQ